MSKINVSLVVKVRWDEEASVFVSSCPSLGILSQGTSEQEALEAIESAVKGYLKGMEELDAAGRVLDYEIKRYEANYKDWLKTYKDQYVVIYKDNCFYFFTSLETAIEQGRKMYGNVPMLVRQVLTEQPVVTIGSPVITDGYGGWPE